MREYTLHFERTIINAEDDDSWESVLRRGADLVAELTASGHGNVTDVRVDGLGGPLGLDVNVRIESDEEVERLQGH